MCTQGLSAPVWDQTQTDPLSCARGLNQSAKTCEMQRFPNLKWSFTSTNIVLLSKGLRLHGKSSRGQGISWVETGGHHMFGPLKLWICEFGPFTAKFTHP